MEFFNKQSSVTHQTIPQHPASTQTTTEEPETPEVISLGTPVRILRGSLRGCTGKISGSTNDGVFFIQRDLGTKQKGNSQSPDGPFLGNEFEILD